MKSYDWIKQIPSSLLQWDDIPLTGASPPFPWQALSQKLAQIFELDSLRIELFEKKWRTEKEFDEGIANAIPLHLSIGNIEGSVVWLMAREDLAALMALLLKSSSTSPVESDKDFFEGFALFTALQTLHALQELKFAPGTPIRIKDNGSLPNEAALSFDVKISLPNLAMTARLLLSSKARKGWADLHQPKIPDIYYQEPLAEKITLAANLEVGKTTITKMEWENIAAGDFIMLDSCTIDPAENKGRVLLKVHGIPLFTGALENGNVTILERTQLHEG